MLLRCRGPFNDVVFDRVPKYANEQTYQARAPAASGKRKALSQQWSDMDLATREEFEIKAAKITALRNESATQEAFFNFILEGCAQTAAVGDPVEVVGLLFFLCS